MINLLQDHNKAKPYFALSLLVAFILHLFVGQWLGNQSAPIYTPKQKVMEVLMVTPPKPIEPPKPVVKEPPPPPPKPKPLPPKKQAPLPPKVKPVLAPKPPVPKAAPPKILAQPAKPVDLPKETFTVPDAPANPAPVIAKPAIAAPSPPKPSTTNANSGSNSSKGSNSGVVVISQVKPTYPARAMSRHIEGWVKIEFTVTPDGNVSDPSIVAAEPEGIFDDAALNAIRKWKFKEKIVDGRAVAQKAVQTLKFKLLNQ